MFVFFKKFRGILYVLFRWRISILVSLEVLSISKGMKMFKIFLRMFYL